MGTTINLGDHITYFDKQKTIEELENLINMLKEDHIVFRSSSLSTSETKRYDYYLAPYTSNTINMVKSLDVKRDYKLELCFDGVEEGVYRKFDQSGSELYYKPVGSPDYRKQGGKPL